jgi:ABC-type molybdate transport system substrate-binding protein
MRAAGRPSRRGGSGRDGTIYEPVVVFAAASLKNALDEAAAAWTKETGGTTRISYAGSNALAKQRWRCAGG